MQILKCETPTLTSLKRNIFTDTPFSCLKGKLEKLQTQSRGKAVYSFVSPKPHQVGDVAVTCGLCVPVLSPPCPAVEFMTSVHDSSWLSTGIKGDGQVSSGMEYIMFEL